MVRDMKNSSNLTSRPLRSFLATNLKPVKLLHFKGEGAQYIGESEPIYPSIEVQNKWTQREYDEQLSIALNWYSGTQDDKDITGHALNALGLSGHFPELIVAIKNSVFPLSLTAAKVIRMAHNGFHLRFHERRFVVRAIRECLNNQKEIVDRDPSTPKPNIQAHLNTRVRKVKGEIDGLFDQFVQDGYTYGGLKIKDTNEKKALQVVADILREPEFTIPVARAKDLIEYFQKYLSEYQSALAGKLPFAEAYSPLGKRQLKAAVAFWEQAITDINIFAQQKQSNRKTRKKKAKPPTQIVSKIKYVKVFPELKLESIDPVKILTMNELWVFNTRLRKLGRYTTLNDAPFEVKGTRLTNIDPLKSVQKTLRKPAEQLKEFGNYTKIGALKWFNNIKAVATPMREAVSGDSILLKGYK